MDYYLVVNQRDKNKRFIAFWVPLGFKKELQKLAKKKKIPLSRLVEEILKDGVAKGLIKPD